MKTITEYEKAKLSKAKRFLLEKQNWLSTYLSI